MDAIKTDLTDRVLSQGRYEVRRKLGQGSMGHVFLAWDSRLHNDVVIKVPTDARLRDAEFHQRFLQESRLLTQLSHPRIVKILDVGEDDGVPYYVMPYIRCGNLLERLNESREGANGMSPQSLTSWLRDVAEALDFMHRQGYVHRDVKPANILFDEHGHAYLSDFGLSKVLQAEEDGHSGMTAANAVVGTPNYVAPELVLARRDYDGKVDQYSLAVTVYEVLSGKPPLEGGSPTATMVNQTTMHPKSLNERNPAIPAEIATAVRLAMSKRPWRRYDSCVAFADAVLSPLDSSGHSDITSSSRSSATGYSTVIEDRPHLFVAGVTRGTGGDIDCPSCGKSIALKARYAGQRGACVHCKAQLLISHDLNELHWLKNVELAASDADLETQSAPIGASPAMADTESEIRWCGLRFTSRRAMWWTLLALAALLIAAAFAGRQTVSLAAKPDFRIKLSFSSGDSRRVAHQVPLGVVLIGAEGAGARGAV